ncbi:MAG: 50S ribosomal protein L7ae-like protein [Clostridiales bacterium]|nr:50S ribosomal protein L7ae-like protein [Clostridiales bacterium]
MLLSIRLGMSERSVRKMLEKLKNSQKVVGTRRLVRAILAGEISEAYIAQDADLFIVRQVKDACNKAGVRIVEVDSMKKLGEACGVDVKTASAGILK